MVIENVHAVVELSEHEIIELLRGAEVYSRIGPTHDDVVKIIMRKSKPWRFYADPFQ